MNYALYQRRLDYNIHCEHELAIPPKFNQLHYNLQWLNNIAFNKIYQGLAPASNVRIVKEILVPFNSTHKIIARKLLII